MEPCFPVKRIFEQLFQVTFPRDNQTGWSNDLLILPSHYNGLSFILLKLISLNLLNWAHVNCTKVHRQLGVPLLVLCVLDPLLRHKVPPIP